MGIPRFFERLLPSTPAAFPWWRARRCLTCNLVFDGGTAPAPRCPAKHPASIGLSEMGREKNDKIFKLQIMVRQLLKRIELKDVIIRAGGKKPVEVDN